MREFHIRRIDKTKAVVRFRDLQIAIVTTPQRLGGARRWFACPKCEGRCAILYETESLACGRCTGIIYPSTRQSTARRIRDQADQLFARLNVDTSHHPRCLGPKPVGMSWARYRALIAKALDYDARAPERTLTKSVRAA